MKRSIQWTGDNLKKLKVFIGPKLIEVFEDYKGGVTLKFSSQLMYIPRDQWLSEHENGDLVRTVEDPQMSDPLGR